MSKRNKKQRANHLVNQFLSRMELEQSSSSPYPHGICNGDGCCNVYEQIFHNSENTIPMTSLRRLKGYSRYRDTSWCSCTLQTCLAACPNSFMCGSRELFKWYLACHNGRCCGCNILVGRDLQVMDKSSDESWECPVCMVHSAQACAFPDCPSRHAFCVECMRKLLFGIETFDEHGFLYFEGGTNACPMCRHAFDPADGWHKHKNL